MTRVHPCPRGEERGETDVFAGYGLLGGTFFRALRSCKVEKLLAQQEKLLVPDYLACKNIRFSSLFAAGDVSRGGTETRNVPRGEERGETDVFAGYGLLGGTFFRALRSCSKKPHAKLEKATIDLPVASVIYILSSLSLS